MFVIFCLVKFKKLCIYFCFQVIKVVMVSYKEFFKILIVGVDELDFKVLKLIVSMSSVDELVGVQLDDYCIESLYVF